MALWHFIKDDAGVSWDDKGTLVSEFDDGLCYQPNEDGFSSELADAKAAELGAIAELTGVPGWHARVEREAADAAKAEQDRQAHAAAEAAIDALLNPASPDTDARAAINARFDALLAAAPDRAKDIANLRKAELAAL